MAGGFPKARFDYKSLTQPLNTVQQSTLLLLLFFFFSWMIADTLLDHATVFSLGAFFILEAVTILF